MATHLAEKRLQRQAAKDRRASKKEAPELDLIIVSDVASPYMEEYSAAGPKEEKGWRNWTPAVVFTINAVGLIASLIALYYSLRYHQHFLTVVLTITATLGIVFFFLAEYLKRLPRTFGVPEAFLHPMGKLLKLKLAVYENLVLNRSRSLLQLTGDVFLKHVRRLNYQTVFNDPAWTNRRIMNAVYELRAGEERLEKKKKEGALPEELLPSPALQEVATLAASMGTTLWFTREELERDRMLDALIACGQATLCWNLLEYVEKIKNSKVNTAEGHRLLLNCAPQLRAHWQRFQQDPYWLVKEYNQSLKNSNP